MYKCFNQCNATLLNSVLLFPVAIINSKADTTLQITEDQKKFSENIEPAKDATVPG